MGGSTVKRSTSRYSKRSKDGKTPKTRKSAPESNSSRKIRSEDESSNEIPLRRSRSGRINKYSFRYSHRTLSSSESEGSSSRRHDHGRHRRSRRLPRHYYGKTVQRRDDRGGRRHRPARGRSPVSLRSSSTDTHSSASSHSASTTPRRDDRNERHRHHHGRGRSPDSLRCASSDTNSSASSQSTSTTRPGDRNERRHHPAKGRSPVSLRCLSTDTKSYASGSKFTRNVMSMDTAENSESKLQNIGHVVNASDLSDYSDHYTLDSKEMGEFEDFMHKHRHKTFKSGGSSSSALYSLADASEKATTEPSEETSGIVAADSAEVGKRGVGQCAVRACFCVDDDSIQGSYGGLRDGEVLIASSTLSSHESEELPFDASVSTEEASRRSESRCLERLESDIDSPDSTEPEHDSPKTSGSPSSGSSGSFFWCWGSNPVVDPSIDDDDDDRKEKESLNQSHNQAPRESRADSPCSLAMEHEEESSETKETPNSDGNGFFFGCWGSSPAIDPSIDVDDRKEEEHSHRIETRGSGGSRIAVWQRSDEESVDSMEEESISEDRAEAIGQTARANNILNRFRTKSEPSETAEDSNEQKDGAEPTLSETIEDFEEQNDNAEPTPSETFEDFKEQKDNAEDKPEEHATSTLLENEHMVAADASSNESALQSIFVLGDNAVVTSVSEVEAGNGDTAFLIFLHVSRNELSADGKASVARRRFQDGVCPHSGNNMTPWSELEQRKCFEAPIMILSEEQQEQEHPVLIIEDNASAFLASLCQLSEASYYCLDNAAQNAMVQMVQAHQYGFVSDKDVSTAKPLECQSSPTASLSSAESAAQFMFCMRLSDWIREIAASDDSEQSTKEVLDETNESSEMEHPVDKAIEDEIMPCPEVVPSWKMSERLSAPQPWPTAKSASYQDEAETKFDCLESESASQINAPVLEAASSIASTSAAKLESSSGPGVKQSSEEGEKNTKYLRGMSRAAVKAHALRQVGKNSRSTSKLAKIASMSSRLNRDTSETTERTSMPTKVMDTSPHKTFQGSPPKMDRNESVDFESSQKSKKMAEEFGTSVQQTSSSPERYEPPVSEITPTTSDAPTAAGENSASSRLSIRSVGQRSSEEESLHGTRHLGETGKSASSSNHSAAIHSYLTYLDEKDRSGGEGPTSYSADDCVGPGDEQSEYDKRDDLSENDDSEKRDEAFIYLPPVDDMIEFPAPMEVPHSQSIPALAARVFPETIDSYLSMTKASSLPSATTSDISADEVRLQSYANLSRLSQNLLLADTSARLQNRTATAAAAAAADSYVVFEKSQIDQMGLSRQRRATASAASASHGSSTSSSDEFFDAVSQAGSTLSAD